MQSKNPKYWGVSPRADYPKYGSFATNVVDEHKNLLSDFQRDKWCVLVVGSYTPQKPIDSETKRKFFQLASNWKNETRRFSTSLHKTSNDNYIDIMLLGTEVIPIILEELKRKSDHWFLALKHLARKLNQEDPVPKEHLGDMEKMREDWLRWGERMGYKF